MNGEQNESPPIQMKTASKDAGGMSEQGGGERGGVAEWTNAVYPGSHPLPTNKRPEVSLSKYGSKFKRVWKFIKPWFDQRTHYPLRTAKEYASLLSL